MSRHRKNRQHIIKSTTYDRRGRIIATAYNSFSRTHPIQAKLAAKVGQPARIFLHSEINVILKSRGRKIYKLVVERYDSLGNSKNACPCKICQEMIRISGIERVEYTVG